MVTSLNCNNFVYYVSIALQISNYILRLRLLIVLREADISRFGCGYRSTAGSGLDKPLILGNPWLIQIPRVFLYRAPLQRARRILFFLLAYGRILSRFRSFRDRRRIMTPCLVTHWSNDDLAHNLSKCVSSWLQVGLLPKTRGSSVRPGGHGTAEDFTVPSV